MQRSDAGIAAPGEHEFLRAPRADHLVVQQIGGHANQREVGASLADDLVPGGERNQVGESLEGDRVPVAHVHGDGL